MWQSQWLAHWDQEGILLYSLSQQRCCMLRSVDSSRVLRAHEYLMETLSTPRGTCYHSHIPAWKSGSNLGFRTEGVQLPTGI